ncbi:hypothetical protein [Bradyrhizobium sp. WSM1743]|uniref:hypothetical protein n=1 Tax=Bradyrhizobium sp. WSM1743 TaxID=318996 RepID=UPI0004084633|nr:hypothetical protein [Bradyrhizobium sp. WSM1743]
MNYSTFTPSMATMKLAGEAEGQRWINAALAWIVLTRLQVRFGREPREETA